MRVAGRAALAAAIICVVALACASQSQQGWTAPAGGSRLAAPSAGPVNCARLHARAQGIEGCPPAQLAMYQPSVGHATGISDADARHMAEGFARSYAIANWAINQGYTAFLQSGLLSSTAGQATSASFGDDLREIYLALRAGSRYRIDTPLKLAAVWAAPVPAAMAEQARKLQLAPGPYALALAFQGPYASSAGGKVVVSYPASYSARIVMFGELRNDIDLGGWVWSWGGYVSCAQQWAGGLCHA